MTGLPTSSDWKVGDHVYAPLGLRSGLTWVRAVVVEIAEVVTFAVHGLMDAVPDPGVNDLVVDVGDGSVTVRLGWGHAAQLRVKAPPEVTLARATEPWPPTRAILAAYYASNAMATCAASDWESPDEGEVSRLRSEVAELKKVLGKLA